MNKLTPHRVLVVFLLSFAALGAGPAGAQVSADKYPTRSIRVIVPFVPAGGTDVVARHVAPLIAEGLGQSVVIDNRAGGGGNIGHEMVVRAAPDGYTLCITSASYATNAALFKLTYDPVQDITPIAMISEAGFMVSVHPSVLAKTLPELIALAKAKPGALNYASTGTGGVTHLATELFNLQTGTKMTHIPYKGTGAAVNDLLGGHVQLIVGGMAVMVTMHKAGRLRGLAVTTAKRIPAVPELPTVAETVPGFEAVLWFGAFGPKNLPKNVLARWNAEMNKAINNPLVQERLANEGYVGVGGPPEQFLASLKRDVPKWIKVVKDANVRSAE